MAVANLKNLSDDTGQPRREGPMGDVAMFQNVATEAYLRQKGYSKFQTMEQAKQVIGEMVEFWNREIAPRHQMMDAMTPEKKLEWFKKICRKARFMK